MKVLVLAVIDSGAMEAPAFAIPDGAVVTMTPIPDGLEGDPWRMARAGALGGRRLCAACAGSVGDPGGQSDG